eukprot:GHVN01106505.1.p1 GENE.GHVN01106505.1~~GHVN01106505.1.p1  ORF type:complete len:240 (+),score=19.85 GHVN01106505.1:68-787(+)
MATSTPHPERETWSLAKFTTDGNAVDLTPSSSNLSGSPPEASEKTESPVISPEVQIKPSHEGFLTPPNAGQSDGPSHEWDGELHRFSTPKNSEPPCDACPFCPDVCDQVGCPICGGKPECDDMQYLKGADAFAHHRFGKTTQFTMCQVRRHKQENDCWLVADNKVYDATPIMFSHPGGTRCLLLKAGGTVDCAVDLAFHTRSGRREWCRCQIGYLVDCPSEGKTRKTGWSASWEQCTIM